MPANSYSTPDLGQTTNSYSTPSLGQAASGATSLLNMYNGIQSGTPTGEASAAVNAGSAYNSLYGNNAGSAIPGVGVAGNILGVVTGLEQGGVKGDASAAVNAASLYGDANALDVASGGTGLAGAGAAGAIGSAAGLVGVALAPALYGESKPAVQLNSTYFGNINNSIESGLSANASVQQKLGAAQGLQTLQGMLGGSADQGAGGVSGGNPASILAGMQKYGITNPSQINTLVNQLLDSIPADQMPGQGAEAQSAHGGDLGVIGDNPNVHAE
jgi:hypothetical protein